MASPDVVLQAGPEPVGSWPQYYDSLTLLSPTRYSGMPEQFPHENLPGVDGPYCRRGAAGGSPHAGGPAAGGLAGCHQDHLVSLRGLPR